MNDRQTQNHTNKRGLRLGVSRFAALAAIGAMLAGGASGAWADAPAPVLPSVAPAAAPATDAAAGQDATTSSGTVPFDTVDTPLPEPIELPAPPPSALPPDLPAGQITADQAAAFALRHQPDISASGGQVTAAQGVTQQARSGLGPSVAVTLGSADASVITGAGATVSSNGVSTSAAGVTNSGVLSLRQLLFDFGHTKSLVSQAKGLENAADATLTRTQSDTVLSVKQAYYTLVQDQRLVTVNEANYRSQLAHVALARARQAAGIGLPSDVVAAQTTVSEAALNVTVARNNASTARVALALAMGLDARAPLTPTDGDEAVPATYDVNALIADALKNRPDVVEALNIVSSDKAAVDAARTSNAPSIAATVGFGAKGSDLPPDASSLTVGAAVVWSPFDSGLTSGRVKQAQGELVTAQQQLVSVQQTVMSDVSQAYLNERLAAQRVTQADDEIKNAQTSVQLAEGRYKAGIGVFIDVTDAQQQLLTAQTDRVNAQSALDQARAALAHAIGAGM